MHEEVPSNSEEMKWSPESGLPPPLTPEYGYAEVLLAPATPPLSGTVHERKSIEEESSPLRVQLQQLKNEMSKVEEVDGEEVERDSILEQTHKVKNFIESRELLERLVQEGDERLLTKEERANVLSPEVLATLSTEEYVALWKRLSPHYVSHVTRQGYRENYFTYHSKGLGEFHDGFKGILENGKDIKSPMMISGDSNGVEMQKKLADYLEHIDFSQLESEDPWDSGGVESYPNPWKKLKMRLTATLASSPKLPDKMAVHLASDQVLDDMYGGETGNQVFAVYPSDMVASQYDFAFNGSHFDQTFTHGLPDGEAKWNDVFVWDKDDPMESAISLDAGIVFLPKSTPVDTKSGSKYASYKTDITDTGEKIIDTEIPDNPITSEVYWNNYFLEHPELKPKHVVFYDGNPTQAVQGFMQQNGITAKVKEIGATNEEGALGFDEHHIVDMKKDPRTQGMEQSVLRQGALVVIDFFARHPEHSPDELMNPNDLEEIRALVE